MLGCQRESLLPPTCCRCFCCCRRLVAAAAVAAACISGPVKNGRSLQFLLAADGRGHKDLFARLRDDPNMTISDVRPPAAAAASAWPPSCITHHTVHTEPCALC